MVALFDYSAVGHDDDLIGMDDRREAVSNDDHGAIVRDFRQRALDRRLGFIVDGAGGFIQHQNWRVLQQSPREGQALTLPPESLTPRSPTAVSRPAGNFSINSQASAVLAACTMACSSALGFP